MSGKLRLYKDKLEGYNRFYSIVKTIKMVTLAKYRAAQSRIRTRDFSLRYTELAFSKPHTTGKDIATSAKNALVYIPITTNRGSCGALNSNTVRCIDSLASSKMVLLPVGKRGIDSFSKLYPDEFRYGIINDMKESMHFAYASYILENAYEVSRDADQYQVIFHRFVSAGVQKHAQYSIPSYERWKEDLADAASTDNQKNRYLFANALQNEEERLIRDFYDFHATLAVLNAVGENELSEQAARLVAVEGQLTNISSLQQRTSSLYNKTRQFGITAALIEILSAMSSLEGNATKGVQKVKFWEGVAIK
ncbi:putative ATP synthase [Trypanosoma vivax]|uniref:ATP synthase F1 subunit gamma protein, putative n=1 Tax=Trypanosoma vivax (strain Y486) TaxID=1055687 RepID=F9WQ20_TRYVY|nr:putative ATP synthase [Trypanosoma vivax]CCD19647.1 ATP synthase F1 subunit gamma protein, putative [Trypanosoma vivax Y486]|eukprot:CCD19647.1 ATP synthase F1 subunit gamma protein, putative [Trypanosoma vivax Y486]